MSVNKEGIVLRTTQINRRVLTTNINFKQNVIAANEDEKNNAKSNQ